MIKSFECRHTEELFETGRNKRLGGIRKLAIRRLDYLHSATSLDDLRAPPNFGLHPLVHDKAGYWAITVQAGWRLCFRWADGNAEDVHIEDYH